MGLSTKPQNYKYVQIKNGKLFLSPDKETPYDQIEGLITDIGVKQESYQGQDYEKIYVILDSEGERYNVAFNIESGNASSFMTFIKNADLAQPVTLVPLSKTDVDDKGMERTKSSILISQNGKFLKSYYTKDEPKGMPPFKQVKVSGKIVWDKSDVIDFYKDVIANELRPNLTQPAAPVAGLSTATQGVPDDIEDESLPF